MVIKSVLSTIGVVVVAGLMIQSTIMTGYFKKLDSGMNDNLKATKQVLQVEQNIQNKNGILDQSLKTTKTLNQKFGEAVIKSQQVDALVAQVVALNNEILQMNQQNVTFSGDSGQHLTQVKQALTGLLDSTNALKTYLGQLNQTTESDEYWLGLLKQSSDNLNNKTP